MGVQSRIKPSAGQLGLFGEEGGSGPDPAPPASAPVAPAPVDPAPVDPAPPAPAVRRVPRVTDRTWQERFEKFHLDNPWVYDTLVQRCLELRSQGHRRYGLNVLFTELRWLGRDVATDEPFRVNQNFISRYARLIMASEPELAEFFETRPLRG